MPADITGTNIMVRNEQGSSFKFEAGPIFANVVLADEINRATPKTQSALLEAMQEHTVTVGDITYALPDPFFVIATQNPIEQEGTYPLPEAQLDRFLMKINMGYPSNLGEVEIINRFLNASPIENISRVVTTSEILEMREEVKSVFIHPSLIEYIVNIVNKTRNLSEVAIGVSPRGTISLVNACRAYAYIEGRDYVVPEDIKALSKVCLAHRLVLSSGGFARDNKEQIIDRIFNEVVAPTEEWNK
jgi:MoxR-like ATPase